MFTILDPGALTTVQDAGRIGWGRYGIPPSGPMDPVAFVAANRLVGNPANAAGLEITLTGPSLRAWRDCLVAVCGADFELWAGKLAVPMGHAIYVRAGYTLRFGRRHNGARAYLAVDGGIDVPAYLGSRATYLKGGFGGLEGRALRPGDQLPLGNRRGSSPIIGAGVCRPTVSPTKNPTLRAVIGPQADHFSTETIESFFGNGYTVTASADRMGIRLQGARLHHIREAGIISDGIVTGCVQIPPNGQPIAMMVDHQTIGGYPKIATVIRADLPLLAQCLPGDEVRFARVTLNEARSAYRRSREHLES